MGVIGRLARRAILLGAAVLAVTVAAVVYASERNFDRYGPGMTLASPVDAIIVLGGGVDPDGVLGYSSRRRVAGAVALMRAGRAERLILAGGNASNGADPETIEARLMRRWALELGAAEEALLVEDRSHSTFENLRFGFALAERHGLRRLAVLTDAFHLERARWLAAYLGRPDIAPAAVPGLGYTGPHDRAWSTLREAMAWWYNLLKIAGWEALGAAGMDEAARREWIR